MRHDDQSALERGRFFAKIDRMVNEVSVSDSCGGDVPPVPVAGGFLDEGNIRTYTPPVEEESDGTVDPTELMGDWSWRPENQVKDPGYTFTKDELLDVEWALFQAREHFGMNEREAMRYALAEVPAQPWMVPAYKGTAQPPPRIRSIR